MKTYNHYNKLFTLLIIFFICFVFNNCVGIAKKHKKAQNKVTVFFNQPISLTPLYSYKDGTFPDITRSYREMIEASPKDDTLLEKVFLTGVLKDFRRFNRSVVDKAVRNTFRQLARLTGETLNGRYPWLKAINAFTVKRVRAVGGGIASGHDFGSGPNVDLEFSVGGFYGPAMGVDLGSSSAYQRASRFMEDIRERFLDGEIERESDWEVEITIVDWLIYSKAFVTSFASGIPTSGETAQKITIQMKIYDKKTKSKIFDQKVNSEMEMNKKSVVEMGREVSAKDVEDWDQKTNDQIRGLIDQLIYKMNQ